MKVEGTIPGEEESGSAMRGLYDSVRDAPNSEGNLFKLLALKAGVNANYSYIGAYREAYRGVRGRLALWRDLILPKYYELGFEEMARKGDLGTSVSNNFFRSGMRMSNNQVELLIRSPKFSTIFSHIYGERIKATLKKKGRGLIESMALK